MSRVEKKGTDLNDPLTDHRFMVTCPKGLENVLAKEMVSLGAQGVQESIAACYFSSNIQTAYGICLWSRLANRVILLLLRDRVETTEQLHDLSAALPYSTWFDSDKTVAIDFNGTNAFIRDARFGSQLIKDTLNEHFMQVGQSRLNVELDAPDISIYVRLFKSRVSIGIDLVGESLHRRGYRQPGASAPLKENLAAALLLLCDWPGHVAKGGAFVDPMSGSGTLLIEAALMAAKIAPSYLRGHWPLENLNNFDAELWSPLRQAARDSIENLATLSTRLLGYDNDPRAVAMARDNIAAAGLEACVEVAGAGVASLNLPDIADGLLVTNPPYGKRLGDVEQLDGLYAELGDMLKRECNGWQAAIFTGNPTLGWSTGLRSWRQHKLFNGSIECQLQRIKVEPDSYRRPSVPHQGVVSEASLSEQAIMLANRLRKNQRRLKAWLAANPNVCYRVYDAELPEYAVAIDCYRGVKTGVWGETTSAEPVSYFHIQEYAAPASIDSKVATRRLSEAVAAVSQVFNVDLQNIVQKRRAKQKGTQQYQKLNESAPDFLVEEGGHRFKVNLGRYLDTGLFLDHRPVRALVADSTRGGRFLNLFAYTSSATVYAARGGARSSVSVDMSRTYIEWSGANFKLNAIESPQHQLIQADCLEWLKDNEQLFDCILLDPPSFSNSSRMSSTLDIQRDHEMLIALCMPRLAEHGDLYFSNNKRGFKLAPAVAEQYRVEDLTHATHDPDFNRPRPVHYCWRIKHREQ